MGIVTSPISDEQQIRAIIFREGDLYVAQCLEYDISAQARDLDALLMRLDLTIEAEFAACEADSRQAKECIGPSPNYYHGLWDKRSIELTRVNMAAPTSRRRVQFAMAA